MVEGVVNAPYRSLQSVLESHESHDYLAEFDSNLRQYLTPLLFRQKRNFQWQAVETIEYMAIGSDKSPYFEPSASPEIYTTSRRDILWEYIFGLLSVLDSADSPTTRFQQSANPAIAPATTINSPIVPSVYPQSRLQVRSRRYFQNYELIECMVILSTVLTEYLGSVSAAAEIMKIYGVYREHMPHDRLIYVGVTHIDTEVWATAGRIAGLQREARSTLQGRYQKWDINHSKSAAAYPHEDIKQFLRWLMTDQYSPAFVFDVMTQDPSQGARLYALVEFLIKVGFRLKQSIGMISTGTSGMLVIAELQARVEKTIIEDGGVEPELIDMQDTPGSESFSLL
jgi:hypothetical protein